MANKSEIETELKAVFAERFVHLWWDLKLPGLGYATPNEIFSQDPQTLYNYVKAYRA